MCLTLYGQGVKNAQQTLLQCIKTVTGVRQYNAMGMNHGRPVYRNPVLTAGIPHSKDLRIKVYPPFNAKKVAPHPAGPNVQNRLETQTSFRQSVGRPPGSLRSPATRTQSSATDQTAGLLRPLMEIRRLHLHSVLEQNYIMA